MTDTIKILMVCLGNICRSPTAEGVFRAQVEQAGLGGLIQVDSAGTSDWHAGEPPDQRSVHHAAGRSYDLSSQRARQVSAHDFTEFAYILAMDKQNLHDLEALCPPAQRHKLGLFLQHARSNTEEVPDPYQYGAEQFEQVLDLAEEASRGFLAFLREQHAHLRGLR